MTKLARLHKPYYGCVIVILVIVTLIQIDQAPRHRSLPCGWLRPAPLRGELQLTFGLSDSRSRVWSCCLRASPWWYCRRSVMLINEDWFVCCVWLAIDYDRLAAISWLSYSTSDFGLSCLPNLECIVSVLCLRGDWLGLVSCLNHYRILTESDCAVILNCYWIGIVIELVLKWYWCWCGCDIFAMLLMATVEF